VKPHPRIRKTVKWGGAVVAVLLLTLWISSRWWFGGYRSRGGTWVCVGVGMVGIEYATTSVPPQSYGFDYDFNAAPDLVWWFDWGSQPPWAWIWVPLWVPTVPLLLATVAAWRLDAVARRRTGAGCCAKCGYDLRGLREGAVCPECGSNRAGKREGA
jgi:hypothetical protein